MSSPSIAIREWLVVALGGITLAATAWLLGGVRVFGLHCFLAGSVLTLLAAVLPLPQKWNGLDGLHGNGKNILRLLKFPFFWISLLFLGYMTIQSFNHAWVQRFVEDSPAWWVSPEPHIEWLPSGVKGEYSFHNSFRVMVNFGAAFMLMWAFWVGIQRRVAALTLLWTFVLSGVGMALLALIQKFTGATKLFWTIPSPNPEFWGSFFYGNQGAAYLILVMVGAAALYFYSLARSTRRGQSGGAYLLLFFLIALVYLSVCMAMSRGGILFGTLFLLGFVLCNLLRWVANWESTTPLKVRALIGVLVLAGCGYVWSMVDVSGLEGEWKKMQREMELVEQNLRYRFTTITWEMAQEKLVLGAGAGSWLYLFPMEQVKYPELFYTYYRPADPDHPNVNRRKEIARGRQFNKYAHNDIVQFLYEFGIVGCSILLLGYLYLFGLMAWHSGGQVFSALVLLIGMGVVCGHAFADFTFQAPAYWIALNALILLVVKLLVLEGKRAARSS